MYEFRLEAISGYFIALPASILVTLELSLLALAFSTLAGLTLAQIRLHGPRPLAVLVRAYVEVFRNIPILILLYVCFFGLAQMGLHLSGFWAAVVALTLNATAYCTEIFRAGYAAVALGQREAALSLGLRAAVVELKVILPQVVRVILPAYANQCIGILLGSSVAAIIGVRDLADWMFATGSSTFRYMESFLVAAVVYIVLCQMVAAAAAMLERRQALPSAG
jgi:His/Glu/Gln/Arg/opine family amino acid ABC transporter permease subunit